MMSELWILIILGVAGMLLLVVAIILFVMMHQRKSFRQDRLLKQRVHEAQEETMSQLASELHDDVGVLLSSVKLFLSKASAAQPEIMQQSQQLLDESIGKIRALSHRLHPASLQHLGLRQAVQALLEVIGSTGTIRTTMMQEQEWPALPEQTELAVYRMVQELLNNLIRHAHPGKITVCMEQHPNELRLRILHDGAGMTNEQYLEYLVKPGAVGLKNIYNRLQLVEGRINFIQHEQEGQSATVLTIPHNQKQET